MQRVLGFARSGDFKVCFPAGSFCTLHPQAGGKKMLQLFADLMSMLDNARKKKGKVTPGSS